MRNKNFVFILFLLFSSITLTAKTDIDRAITKAAIDIVEKCNAKSILMIDDFTSPTKQMTTYIREQLADAIFAEDGFIKIVTRRNMNKIERELAFQNSGVVSEKTILNVASRLGANFIIFGKLEEYNGNYIFRVRMLDIKKATYLFRKTYQFQHSHKTEQLLGRSPNYKKVAIGITCEANKNSLDYISPMVGLKIDYSLFRKFAIGANVFVSKDLYEKANELFILETLCSARYNLISPTGEPVSGLFVDCEFGITTLFYNDNTKVLFNIGAGTGYRFALNNFFIEPELRFGYPYLFGAGLTVGMRF